MSIGGTDPEVSAESDTTEEPSPPVGIQRVQSKSQSDCSSLIEESITDDPMANSGPRILRKGDAQRLTLGNSDASRRLEDHPELLP